MNVASMPATAAGERPSGIRGRSSIGKIVTVLVAASVAFAVAGGARASGGIGTAKAVGHTVNAPRQEASTSPAAAASTNSDRPEAHDDHASTSEATAVAIDVLANDT